MSTRMLQRTPCVGICSTTYGDLVCRGCKRFAHEIDQWNGYQDDQRSLVWERLFTLRQGALLVHVTVVDADLVLRRAKEFRVPDLDALNTENVAYEVVRRAGRVTDFASLGLKPLSPVQDASVLYQLIEQELYARSIAQYERDFRLTAQ